MMVKWILLGSLLLLTTSCAQSVKDPNGSNQEEGHPINPTNPINPTDSCTKCHNSDTEENNLNLRERLEKNVYLLIAGLISTGTNKEMILEESNGNNSVSRQYRDVNGTRFGNAWKTSRINLDNGTTDISEGSGDMEDEDSRGQQPEVERLLTGNGNADDMVSYEVLYANRTVNSTEETTTTPIATTSEIAVVLPTDADVEEEYTWIPFTTPDPATIRTYYSPESDDWNALKKVRDEAGNFDTWSCRTQRQRDSFPAFRFEFICSSGEELYPFFIYKVKSHHHISNRFGPFNLFTRISYGTQWDDIVSSHRRVLITSRGGWTRQINRTVDISITYEGCNDGVKALYFMSQVNFTREYTYNPEWHDENKMPPVEVIDLGKWKNPEIVYFEEPKVDAIHKEFHSNKRPRFWKGPK